MADGISVFGPRRLQHSVVSGARHPAELGYHDHQPRRCYAALAVGLSGGRNLRCSASTAIGIFGARPLWRLASCTIGLSGPRSPQRSVSPWLCVPSACLSGDEPQRCSASLAIHLSGAWPDQSSVYMAQGLKSARPLIVCGAGPLKHSAYLMLGDHGPRYFRLWPLALGVSGTLWSVALDILQISAIMVVSLCVARPPRR